MLGRCHKAKPRWLALPCTVEAFLDVGVTSTGTPMGLHGLSVVSVERRGSSASSADNNSTRTERRDDDSTPRAGDHEQHPLALRAKTYPWLLPSHVT
jgi:hypothetical protein